MLAGCSGSSDATTAAASATAPTSGNSDWTLVMEDVGLPPTGIGIVVHPTREPIVVAVSSPVRLEICPAGPAGRPTPPTLSSFGRRWTSCLPLSERAVALPATDGRSHVGFRIRPVDGEATGRSALRIRWACEDTYFALDDPSGALTAPVPRCGAAPAEGE